MSLLHNNIKNMGHQNMNLVLSTDTKPRLKWTPQLHQRFVEAVNQVGGADKATPKSLMRIMGISGLTLYHLKSHLQKYRLGKFQQTEICHSNKLDDYKEIQSNNGNSSDGTHNQMNESLQIAQALQMQMEVQRKLHEQILVQRHLQLRIEAQGKYLQLVLKKAQETLVGYSSSSAGVGLAKAELSRLGSMVNTGCTSSLFSELTKIGDSSLKEIERSPIRGTMSYVESSFTTSESCRRKDVEPPQDENICTRKSNTSAELSLMEVHTEKKPLISGSSNQANGKKRSGSDFSDGILVEQPLAKRREFPGEETGYRLRKSGLLRSFDLNSQCHNDTESASKAVDLNCRE
ncbi:hypothetical protein ERO13_A04G147200v2 [Gossypium hirsutum]|uniref:Myb family transcription factor PHL8 n=2 Tax=Gossypium TaxID=3633 RepID=A0ABM3BKZ6_GOSHI|nr:myb family transcription factor PHL8-like [Gossypium hirsutum]KAG4206178.1 hypothetical protein ERO13_A04G147200v2 [Gossypium hirsutum]TYJ41112.1 hypothetical protein E1A91_A04G186800v1 [Gossypium mustelinum]